MFIDGNYWFLARCSDLGTIIQSQHIAISKAEAEEAAAAATTSGRNISVEEAASILAQRKANEEADKLENQTYPGMPAKLKGTRIWADVFPSSKPSLA